MTFTLSAPLHPKPLFDPVDINKSKLVEGDYVLFARYLGERKCNLSIGRVVEIRESWSNAYRTRGLLVTKIKLSVVRSDNGLVEACLIQDSDQRCFKISEGLVPKSIQDLLRHTWAD